MARMAAAALRAHTTLPVPLAAGCGRALPGCGRTPAGAPMLRRRFSLSFSWMIETLAPVPSHRWGLDLRRRRSIAWWPSGRRPGVALAWVAGGGLDGTLALPGGRRPCLVACLARIGLAGLLGAPAYGKHLHLSCADPPTVARAWKRARGEGDSGAGCGDGDGERHARRRPVGSSGVWDQRGRRRRRGGVGMDPSRGGGVGGAVIAAFRF